MYFPELYVVLREPDSATIVIEVSEHIHCKCNSDPSYLVLATVRRTKLLDLLWYMFMKTVMAVSGAAHPIPCCIRYSPRLAAFFLLLLSSLPLCCWQMQRCFIRFWRPQWAAVLDSRLHPFSPFIWTRTEHFITIVLVHHWVLAIYAMKSSLIKRQSLHVLWTETQSYICVCHSVLMFCKQRLLSHSDVWAESHLTSLCEQRFLPIHVVKC